MRIRALLSLLAVFCGWSASAIESQDYAVQIIAVVSASPPQIVLRWIADPDAIEYVVSRRVPGEEVWTDYPPLPGTAVRFVDRIVSIGSRYEYRIVKRAQDGTVPYTGYGFIEAGIAVRPIHDRGKLVLLVDETIAAGLDSELARLTEDLVGDGWKVLRHDVSRIASVPEIKAIIKSDYDADPARVEAVFLFGHVPVPYSGDLNPDGHRDHQGAWPADAFYGDMDAVYTDETVNRTIATRPENYNVPGDGKFDATLIPLGNGGKRVELQVGRVDLANLPAFPESETELLRRYLDKNHAYRHKLFSVPPRALIDDRFGAFVNEAFAVDGWRNFAPLLTSANITSGNWLDSLQSESWLWAYGCGLADYTSIPGLVSTGDFATFDLKAVFVLLFGSYFGDWNTSDNLLRAPLAGSGTSLASVWAGRPHWHFYPMGLGQSIGSCTRLTQNESLLGPYNIGVNEMHVALMGDPTLRIHPIAPPLVFRAIRGLSNTFLLRWHAPLEPVLGYYIYELTAQNGEVRQINTVPLKGTRLTIRGSPAGSIYMLRAVKLESTPSGTYYNLSQGKMVALPQQ